MLKSIKLIVLTFFSAPAHQGVSEVESVESNEPLRLVKRKRHKVAKPEEWEKTENKRLRMEGKVYLGRKCHDGTTVKTNRPERTMGPMCTSKVCASSNFKRKCSLFSFEERTAIHTRFWRDLNWDQKKMFIIGHVTVSAHSEDKKSHKSHSLTYHLTNATNKRLVVCKQMFLNTLSVGERCVLSWTKNSIYGIPIPKNHIIKEKNNEEDKFKIQSFLDSLPKQPSSHNSRKQTPKVYVHESYSSMIQLHKSYSKYCENNNIKPASRTTFHRVFVASDLQLITPEKSQCDPCCNKVQKKTKQKPTDETRVNVVRPQVPPPPPQGPAATQMPEWPSHFLSSLPSSRPYDPNFMGVASAQPMEHHWHANMN